MQTSCEQASLEEKKKVVENIVENHKTRFRTFDNTGTNKKAIGGVFPDAYFMQNEPPPNNNVLFVFKVEAGMDINYYDEVAEWRALGVLPGVLYIVVPKARLEEATKLAAASAVRAKLAWYEVGTDGKIGPIQYE